jgi:2-keto-4-pentenoate hydratase/2-oxohepta-3-ene-1,7-dioic acid hydratase in catechol pathway
MRLCSFRAPDGPRPGLVDGDHVVPLAVSSAQEVIAGGARTAAAGDPLPLAAVVLEAPVVPGNAFGIGLNYRAHAAETGKEPPSEPVLFAKMRGTVNRPSGPVIHPEWTRRLDYEGELGVVIGTRAHRVPASRALDHVFGYLVVDDVSARDRQASEPQWIRAKSGWGFMPMGPWITSADEAGDPQDMRIRTWVNGHVFPLEPGDLITTGTPQGVGVGMDPMRFLAPGDIVRIEIDRLGTIEHEILLP